MSPCQVLGPALGLWLGLSKHWLQLDLLFCLKLLKGPSGDSDMPGGSWCWKGLGLLCSGIQTKPRPDLHWQWELELHLFSLSFPSCRMGRKKCQSHLVTV